MQCPKCHNAMHQLSDLEFSAQQCSSCHGVWVDDADVDLAKQAQAINEPQVPDSSSNNERRKIDCPKCAIPMMAMIHRTQFHIEYEACADCRGAYFDAGELSDLKDFTLVEQLTQVWDTLKTNLK